MDRVSQGDGAGFLASQEGVSNGATADGLVPGAAKSVLNILILEDSFADFDILRRALNKLPNLRARVTRAKTIEDARLLRATEHFHIAFVDYNLGTESGVRFLKETGGRSGETASILVTGLPDPRVQHIALSAGAIGVINKADLTPSLLETTIRSALHTQKIEQQLHHIIAVMAAPNSA